MATVIAFTSGKGGVGKTNISTNLAISLAARNSSVCLFDADTGLANINILLGIHPVFTIEHVLEGHKTIDEITIQSPSGISIVPAASGVQKCTNLDDRKINILTSSFEKLERKFDYILIDTAAGIDSSVLDFVASAQYQVIVITPEPTSLTDSFSLLKMLLIRGEKQSIFILVNRVKSFQDSLVVFKRFQKAVNVYLKTDINYLGYLSDDKHINQAVSQQLPVVISYPDSEISCGFSALADVVKKRFKNDKNLFYFSRSWKKEIKSNSVQFKVENQLTEKKLKVTNAQASSALSIDNNQLSEVYDLLEKKQLSENKLKELLLTLESVYEKKYKKPLKEPNSIIAVIMAEENEDNIKQLYRTIVRNYELQFGKKLNSPFSGFHALLNNERFPKNKFKAVIKKILNIYEKRFNEKYSD
jgi:flagellar biosynthesis protein FlhG